MPQSVSVSPINVRPRTMKIEPETMTASLDPTAEGLEQFEQLLESADWESYWKKVLTGVAQASEEYERARARSLEKAGQHVVL
jgi:hypothetical protein